MTNWPVTWSSTTSNPLPVNPNAPTESHPMTALASSYPLPQRHRVRRLAAPALAAAGVGAGLWVLAVRDPNQPGLYPGCPFHALTGWWCPGCGSLRGLHALAHGQVGQAISLNAVTLVVLVPLVAAIWGEWAWRMWSGRSTRLWSPPAWTSTALAVLFVAFTVIRNTSWGAFLAP
jgi:hypothetical protein